MSRQFTITVSSEPRDFQIIEGGDERSFVINSGVGPAGSAATVSVGTTTTGAAGTNASVTNSGTTSAAVFDFTIPRGEDGAAAEAEVKSASFVAENDKLYHTVATLVCNDPVTPAEGKGFEVFVRNGTANVGGLDYSRAGTTIKRVYHSGGWENYIYYTPILSADISDSVTTGGTGTSGKVLRLNASGGFVFATATREVELLPTRFSQSNLDTEKSSELTGARLFLSDGITS